MTEPRSIAITGLGVISPLGDTVAALGEALRRGSTSIANDAELSLSASRLRDFDSARYAKVRGMRVYPRATQLEISAAALALANAGFGEGAASVDPLQLGVVTASSFSHLETLIEYDKGLATIGMQRTNPTLMPLGLPSAPGAATALAFGAKAFAITLNDGGASGLAALALGARLLESGRAHVCVVAGASTLCRELIVSAGLSNQLCGSGPLRVLDESSQGTAFGEVGAALVLEPAARAQTRGRTPIGHVYGHAATFAAEGGELASALTRACRDSLRRAGIGPEQLALVSSGASGIPLHDRAHARALLDVLGPSAQRAAVTAIKGHLGESLDSSGLVQAIAALHALSEKVAPPIPGLQQPCLPGLRYATTALELQSGVALATATSSSGACSSLILSVASEVST